MNLSHCCSGDQGVIHCVVYQSNGWDGEQTVPRYFSIIQPAL